jgi:hypothetical protein
VADSPGRDFFISYTGINRPWSEWIAVQLEAAGYTTVLQAWDFRPGSDFLHQMQQATTKAGRTIAVLSPAYFGSAFSEAEWRAAFHQDPTGEEGLLVPVRVQECAPPGLLVSRVYVDLIDTDEATARQRLPTGVDQSGAGPLSWRGRRRRRRQPPRLLHGRRRQGRHDLGARLALRCRRQGRPGRQPLRRPAPDGRVHLGGLPAQAAAGVSGRLKMAAEGDAWMTPCW